MAGASCMYSGQVLCVSRPVFAVKMLVRMRQHARYADITPLAAAVHQQQQSPFATSSEAVQQQSQTTAACSGTRLPTVGK